MQTKIKSKKYFLTDQIELMSCFDVKRNFCYSYITVKRCFFCFKAITQFCVGDENIIQSL